MFSQVWNKYLPIIKILMKRSVATEQTLDMNRTDFERAAGGRKVKYSFHFLLSRGRVKNVIGQSPLAKEFATLLQEDDMTRQLLRLQDMEFSMNTNFQLLIRNCTPPAPEPEITSEIAEADTGEAADSVAQNSPAISE